jgi:phosphate uptake regulator
MTHEKAELVEIDAQMLTSVRFLERTGDTIAAIAKEVYFIYTGQKI